jgi:hypothetical protein
VNSLDLDGLFLDAHAPDLGSLIATFNAVGVFDKPATIAASSDEKSFTPGPATASPSLP